MRAGYVVVATPGLGTLNHSALTAEALRTRGLDCIGFVIGSWPQPPDEPDLAMRLNLEDLPSVTGATLLGRVPDGAGPVRRRAVPCRGRLLADHRLTVELATRRWGLRTLATSNCSIDKAPRGGHG